MGVQWKKTSLDYQLSLYVDIKIGGHPKAAMLPINYMGGTTFYDIRKTILINLFCSCLKVVDNEK